MGRVGNAYIVCLGKVERKNMSKWNRPYDYENHFGEWAEVTFALNVTIQFPCNILGREWGEFVILMRFAEAL